MSGFFSPPASDYRTLNAVAPGGKSTLYSFLAVSDFQVHPLSQEKHSKQTQQKEQWTKIPDRKTKELSESTGASRRTVRV